MSDGFGNLSVLQLTKLPELLFGPLVPLGRRLAVPLDRLGHVLGHSEAHLVVIAQIVLGRRVSLLCRLEKPLDRLTLILRNPLAAVVALA